MMSAKQGVVYTAVFGQKDTLRPPLYDWHHPWPQCRFVRFTDQRVAFDFQGWENVFVDISEPIDFPPGRYYSRYYKTLPHKHFPDAPWTIWIDGTHQWREDPALLIDDILPDQIEMATFGHFYTAEDELRQIMGNYPDEYDAYVQQQQAYNAAGFAYTTLIRQGGCLFRKHAPGVNALNEAWWQELLRYGLRDQIPLTYLLWKHQLLSGALPGDLYFHPWFRYTHHDNSKGTCYPASFGDWPKTLRKRMKASLPVRYQRNWLERLIHQWLSWWHGDEPDMQYKYYCCLTCHKLVSWKQLHMKGCCATCGVATKISPATMGWWRLTRVIVAPWSVK